MAFLFTGFTVSCTVGIVSEYRPKTDIKTDITKPEKDLKTLAEDFVESIQKCFSLFCSVNNPYNTPAKPCKLKLKITCPVEQAFTCPADAVCEIIKNVDKKYYCLYASKKVLGKKLQIISRVSYDNPSDYQVLCGEVTGSIVIGSETCKGTFHSTLTVLSGLSQESDFQDKNKRCPWIKYDL